MKCLFFLAAIARLLGTANMAMQVRQTVASSKKTVVQEVQRMNSLSGKRIRWIFVDGPMSATTFEHSFNEDGSVTWRIVDGPHEGATATEKSYAALKVNDKTWVVSYLAASGHTLTVVLNLDDGKAIGFGSSDKSWSHATGTFNFVN